jgi:hypothetical protein
MKREYVNAHGLRIIVADDEPVLPATEIPDDESRDQWTRIEQQIHAAMASADRAGRPA